MGSKCLPKDGNYVTTHSSNVANEKFRDFSSIKLPKQIHLYGVCSREAFILFFRRNCICHAVAIFWQIFAIFICHPFKEPVPFCREQSFLVLQWRAKNYFQTKSLIEDDENSIRIQSNRVTSRRLRFYLVSPKSSQFLVRLREYILEPIFKYDTSWN